MSDPQRPDASPPHRLTVKALREQLSQLPGEADDWPVILSQDAEGNGFSPVEEVTPGCYEAILALSRALQGLWSALRALDGALADLGSSYGEDES